MTRGRKPLQPSDPIPDTLDLPKLQHDAQALDEVGARSRAVAERYGDGEPYERHRVVGEARFYASGAAGAMLELGKRLVLIKENEPHGDFLRIVEGELGMSKRSAQLLMAAAIKYLNPRLAARSQALQLLGPTKLFDLMQEDDGEIAELADGGSVAGLTLDEMAGMTSRELRTALTDARQKLSAKDRVIANKEAKVSALEETIAARTTLDPDQAETAQLDDLRNASLAAEHALMLLAHHVDLVLQTPATSSAELAARQSIDWVVQRLTTICMERGISVDLAESVSPIWIKPIEDIVDAYHDGKAAKGRARPTRGNGVKPN